MASKTDGLHCVHRRGTYFGVYSAGPMLGPILGPIIGGGIVRILQPLDDKINCKLD